MNRVTYQQPLIRMAEQRGPQRPANADELLTVREREILWLEAQGLSYKQIAAQLGISECTVRNHLYAVRQKLDAHSAIEAINRVWPRSEQS